MNGLTELAAQLVACPEWRWRPGMRVVWVRVLGASNPNEQWKPIRGTVTAYESPRRGPISVAWDGGVYDCRVAPAALLPDLTDPATVGCLLAMLPPGWSAASEGSAHCIWLWLPGAPPPDAEWPRFDGATLGEAAARALLAFWGAR